MFFFLLAITCFLTKGLVSNSREDMIFAEQEGDAWAQIIKDREEQKKKEEEEKRKKEEEDKKSKEKK